jgi:hypothetical protein
MAYFHWPPVWVGDSPVSPPGGHPGEYLDFDEIDFRKFKEVVCRATLSSGVRVKAFRDGMFAFGLSKRLSGQRPKDETPTEALIRRQARYKDATGRPSVRLAGTSPTTSSSY